MVKDTLVRIILGGALSKRFGAEWNLYLSNPSPTEAIRAINANTKGAFREYLSGEGAKKFYKVALARKDNTLAKAELSNPSGKGDIYILPTVRGRNSGAAKIIAGIALIAITWGAATPAVAGYLGTTVAVMQTVGYGLAASLILGGIVQMITPVPSFNGGSTGGDGKSSNIFQGNASSILQGGAVPLVYGRALIGPSPISLSFTAIDQAIANSFCVQEYETVTTDGGIIDYVPIPLDPSCSLPEVPE